MTISENTQKELSRFVDWIIATDNVSRLEGGEIVELHEEYVLELHSFWNKISKEMRVGDFELIRGTYGAKDEVAEKIYNTLNRG